MTQHGRVGRPIQVKNESEVTIVALSKYQDIFSGFQDNLNQYAAGYDRVLVQDGYLLSNVAHWKVIQGPRTFCMAGNANIGWKATSPLCDILYIGDDVRLTSPDSIATLKRLAYSDPKIGMLSPKIIGGADNILQREPPDQDLVYSDRYLALICTFIKRAVIERVGYLDEDTFRGGYGDDDADFSRRVKNAGFKLAVTPRVVVTHGLEHKGAETFLRNSGGYDDVLEGMVKEQDKRYLNKWGDLEK